MGACYTGGKSVGIGKKAFFFTTIAIALSIAIILSYAVYTEYTLKDKMGVIEIRVTTMNSFIKDLENDVDNAIFIVGFRSLLSLDDYMMYHDAFLNDAVAGTPSLSSAFDEVFRLGTIDSERMILMGNNTFLNWTEKMKAQANKTGISLDFTINSITISQSEPWKVGVSVNLDIDAQDNKNTAKWDINSKTFTRQINITGFVDPLYLVKTQGKANNTIRRTTVPDFSTTSNLKIHLDNSYYIEKTDAPSYLDRFENDLGPSAYGIESLANVSKLSGLGLGLPAIKTAVDHIYFGSTDPDRCNIEGLVDSYPEYSWFYLDKPPTNHLGFYGAVCNIP